VFFYPALFSSLTKHNKEKEKIMSVENVKAFYKRLREDEEFRTEIAQDESLKDVDIGKLITFARTHGYEFTEADVEKHKEEYRKPGLSQADLEEIAADIATRLH
jgi:predicted ribosomally synthesized peptide with nif11-like leader